MSLHLDSVSLASIVAATSLVVISSLGLWQERSLLVARSLAALALISAWWTLGRGLATRELSLEHPILYMSSQVFSGFFGPTLFLFTLAYTGRIERAGRWLLVLVPGALGTVNVLLLWCLVPEEVGRRSLEQFYAGVPVHGLELATTAPWSLPLLVLHTAQIYAFTFASIFVFVRDARRAGSRRRASDTRLLALVYGGAIAAVSVTDTAAFSESGDLGGRLAPLLSVPFVFVLYRFLRRELRSLAAARDGLLSYLPVQALEQLAIDGQAAKPTELEAAVLFADLRGSTALAERLEARSVAQWLDDFFRRVSDDVIAEGGIVHDLTGDGLLAAFGVPRPVEEPCDAALRAASQHAALARGLEPREADRAGSAGRDGHRRPPRPGAGGLPGRAQPTHLLADRRHGQHRPARRGSHQAARPQDPGLRGLRRTPHGSRARRGRPAGPLRGEGQAAGHRGIRLRARPWR